MSRQIFTYILHQNGTVHDSARELLNASLRLDPAAEVTALVIGSGATLDKACIGAAEYFSFVWKIDHPSCTYPISEVIRSMLVDIIPSDALILIPHEHFGIDLGPGLSIKLNSPYIPDAIDLAPLAGSRLIAVRQEISGLFNTHVSCDCCAGAVISIRPGVFQADSNAVSVDGVVIDKSSFFKEPVIGRRFLKIIEAETGDVDITKSDILVSVGRGIEEQENLTIIHELAAAMGGDVACSRPIVDAKWLEKSRQIGTSGQVVSPKVYLACGISGSFQHMGGIKGAPFIVAINKNPKAPIFQMADVGVVTDLLEFLPELTEAIEEAR